MTYPIGETVIHWTYGPGKIVNVNDKGLPGKPCFYYVIETNQRTLWVPVIENDGSSLRLLSKPSEFNRLINILRSPGEKLSDNPYQRKGQIDARMKKRTLDETCLVIRDLTARSRSRKLGISEISVLKRAEALFLDEWELSLEIPRESARRELGWLLKENPRKNVLQPHGAVQDGV